MGSGGLLCVFGNEIYSNGVIESKGTGFTYRNGSTILTVMGTGGGSVNIFAKTVLEVPIEKCSAERCFRA